MRLTGACRAWQGPSRCYTAAWLSGAGVFVEHIAGSTESRVEIESVAPRLAIERHDLRFPPHIPASSPPSGSQRG
jgi:hypothetical protein